MYITIRSNNIKEEVLGIYLVRGKRYFCYSPDKYDGFIVISEDDVQAENQKIPEFFIEIANGMYHPAVETTVRLEGLLEHDPVSYAEFMKAMNQGSKHA